MDEEELQDLYQWVDTIPLSRPKKNIARDFADGMLVAEVVKHFFPKLVELHNYPAAHSVQQKRYNWKTMSQKVFRKLNFEVDDSEIDAITTCVPGAIERFLRALQTKIQQIQQKKVQRQHQQDHMPMQMQPAAPRGAAAPMPGGGGPPMHGGGAAYPPAQPSSVHMQIIAEKDEAIAEHKETIDILELKVKKLEQLIRLKDSKIQTQAAKLHQHGIK
eukprot:TRINITY_DN35237_c0_g1_i1.p2 TRINITY_DN35237_c0_g1~~TRINITY_DN35237_c0_g1_i1.p2  ORF type:complete len:237 (+),score=86.67 TRINITY_DN35237_c0_g1_i1:62-712(+)